MTAAPAPRAPWASAELSWRTRAAVAAALALAALPWVAAPDPLAARSIEEAFASVVSVLPDWPPDARRLEEPEASGVAVLDGRTVVTALHVVDRARAIRVRTVRGEVLPARLAARDPATDIAILSLEEPLPPMPFQSGEAVLGAPVCAIGNAFGLGLTLTCGVVSGVHKAGVGFNPVEDFVQTDAAVNPGASGGALIDRDGRMVGLLSAIFTKAADANIGVNFAVAAGLVEHVATQLVEHGRVRRARSGLKLTPALRSGETGREAARVVAVAPGSAAERAGLVQGDLIVAVGSRAVRKPADFTSATARIVTPGAVSVTVLRGGEDMTVELELEADQ